MPYGLSSCASNSSLRLSGLPSRRLYGCGVIAVSFIELDSVNVLGVAGGAVRRRKERDQEFVPGSSGRTDQYAGLEYASPPVNCLVTRQNGTRQRIRIQSNMRQWHPMMHRCG